MGEYLPVGKLNMDTLRELLAKAQVDDDRVLVGPQIGEDVAVIEMHDAYLVVKSDPITFATDEIGWYAVTINANDIATSGATPKWFLATVLLPEGKSTDELAHDIFDQIASACADLDVTLVGGHTEVTYGLDRPIVIGQMLGEVAKPHLIRTADARQGDALLLTKCVALEGTAILAREKPAFLADMGQSPEDAEALRNLLHDPGISVVRDARIACQAGRVHAMHDPTEGGVATGIWELAIAANVGVEVDFDELQRLNHYADLWENLDLDPLGVIASGALLISAAEAHAMQIMWALLDEGIECGIIGSLVAPHQGVNMRRGGELTPLPRYDQDEIAKLFVD
jgi:hydrogenase expression/formation protein HypE